MSKLTEDIIDRIAAEKGVSADRFSLSDIIKLSDRDQKLYQRIGLNNELRIISGSTSANFFYQLSQKANRSELDISVLKQKVIDYTSITNLDFEGEYNKVWAGSKSTGLTHTYSNFNIGATGLISIRKTIASNIDIVFPSGTISNAGVAWDSATRTLTLSGAINSYHELTLNHMMENIYKLTYSDEFE